MTDDPVVRRVPVYFVPKKRVFETPVDTGMELEPTQVGNHQQNIDGLTRYLFQYPLNATRPDPVPIVQVKPQSHVFQRLMPIHQSHYSQDAGQRYGDAVRMAQATYKQHEQPTSKKDSTVDSYGRLSKIHMTGHKVAEGEQGRSGQYLMAMFQDGELHASFLEGIVQVRPELRYLDDMTRQAKAAAKMASESTDDSGSEVEDPAAVKANAAAPKKAALIKKTSSDGAVNNAAFQHRQMLLRQMEEENWVTVSVASSEQLKQPLTCQNKGETAIQDDKIAR